MSGPPAPRGDLAAGERAGSRGLSCGLEELAGLISFRVGAWHDLGYEDPPSPDCKPVPPLGERSAEAIRNGHLAVRDIDELIGQLHALRGQLVDELRRNEDLLGARVDAMLAERRDQRAAALAARMSRQDGPQ